MRFKFSIALDNKDSRMTAPTGLRATEKNSGKTDLSCGIVIKVSQLSWSTYRALKFWNFILSVVFIVYFLFIGGLLVRRINSLEIQIQVSIKLYYMHGINAYLCLLCVLKCHMFKSEKFSWFIFLFARKQKWSLLSVQLNTKKNLFQKVMI